MDGLCRLIKWEVILTVSLRSLSQISAFRSCNSPHSNLLWPSWRPYRLRGSPRLWVFLYAFNHCYTHWYLVLYRTCTQAVSVKLCALNPCYAYCYVVSYAARKCFCTYSTVCYAYWYVTSYAARECSCTRAVVAMLTGMLCRTQTVSVLVRIELLLCSLLCRVVCRS